MKRINFIIIKIKKYFLPMLFVLYTMGLIIFSPSNISAAKSGLSLWATSVIPSLFPFFVATELLSHTQLPYILGKIFNPIMKPLFNINGKGSFAFIMGIISGYPTGATIASNFRKKNILPKEECERLLSFTNNSGPLFIIGSAGITMFGNSTIGFLLFITHILSCITIGFLFRFWKKNIYTQDILPSSTSDYTLNKEISFSTLGEVLSESIKHSISTITMIGGFVVLFSVINSMLSNSHFIEIISSLTIPLFSAINIPIDFCSPIFTGIIEITNGIYTISSIHIKEISINIIITSFLLGFGGISILLQVLSIISKTDLSIKPYIYRKNFTRNLCCYLYFFAY